MIVLGIDTATPATVLGLTLPDGATRQARDDPTGESRPGHATRLLPLAAQLLSDAGLGWRELERIAVGVGPGTFTGLRVGIATATGLAQSLGVPLVGVSSLRALALGAGEDAVLAAIDARRGELFIAGYHGEVELLAPQPLAPADLPDLLAAHVPSDGGERWTAVGDGAVLYRSALERLGVRVPEDGAASHRIQARAVCELGALASVPSGRVFPDYLRRPDAAIALEAAASR
jgi:tRNA threonylcarbamoyladenosine biosynthesis protein TsaB